MLNKVNTDVFIKGDFALSLSLRITDASLEPYSKDFTMANGYKILSYSPRKGFMIKDRKSKEEVMFQLETIYEFMEILVHIYSGMVKKDMFYYDELNVLVPNKDEVRKHTMELMNKFGSIRMYPDFRKVDFEDVEGITFLLNKKNQVFLDHSSCKMLIRILHHTDFLTLTESIITNSYLQSMVGRKSNEGTGKK